MKPSQLTVIQYESKIRNTTKNVQSTQYAIALRLILT